METLDSGDNQEDNNKDLLPIPTLLKEPKYNYQMLKFV